MAWFGSQREFQRGRQVARGIAIGVLHLQADQHLPVVTGDRRGCSWQQAGEDHLAAIDRRLCCARWDELAQRDQVPLPTQALEGASDVNHRWRLPAVAVAIAQSGPTMAGLP